MKKKSFFLIVMLLVMFNAITVFGEDASEPSISDSNYIYEENKKTPDVCDNDASANGSVSYTHLTLPTKA